MEKKNLKIFIKSFKERSKEIINLLNEIQGQNFRQVVIDKWENVKDQIDSNKIFIIEINDPVGPAGTVDYENAEENIVLVVSEETLAGGNFVNEFRMKNNIDKLSIASVPLIKDMFKQNEKEEDKISSSTIRLRKLSTLLKPPKSVNLSPECDNMTSIPYIIGLTGGSCCGKTEIGKKLTKISNTIINPKTNQPQQAIIINCDKLGQMHTNTEQTVIIN